MGNYVIYVFSLKSCLFWLGIDALCNMESDPWSSSTPTLYIDKTWKWMIYYCSMA